MVMLGLVNITAGFRIAVRTFIVILGAVQIYAQEPLLWGQLKAGPYTIGYRAFFALDDSREYDGKRARPILFSVWYPAAGAKLSRMVYRQYFDVPALAEYPQFSARLSSLSRNVACQDLFNGRSEASLRPRESAAFHRLLATRTGAALHANAAPGRFPVVLYHPSAGGSFEENSILFEFLASHGYIVVSSAFQSPFADSVSNNVGGIERSGPDLKFLADQVRKWTNADTTRLTAMGHSAGAQMALQWIGTSQCPAVAVVSLDTTLEYDELLRFHKYTLAALEKLIPPRIPVLLLARTTPKPGFSAFREYLRFAPHYEGEAAYLKHDDFLSHGFLGRALMGLRQAPRVRRSYEEVCRTAKDFLDHVLGGNPAGSLFPSPSSNMSSVSVRYRPAARSSVP